MLSIWPRLPGLLIATVIVVGVGPALAQSSDDGEGVDSQVLWTTPGPSNFPTLQSSDIVGHLGVAFGAVFGYYRESLGLVVSAPQADGTTDETTKWAVENAVTADFMWAFGLADIFQIGLVLPVVLDQSGVGATPFQPQGVDDSSYKLAGSALRDLRFNAKTRFVGGNAEIPDRRGFGLGLDVGVTIPSGDELNFAGENGFVVAPLAIFDYHLCKFSIAANVGARLRTEKAQLADLVVGHQFVYGLGVTGHYLDRRLLLSAEGAGLVELDGFDRVGFEYRGAVGYMPDDARAVTLWLSGGSSLGTGDVLGVPQMRLLLGITYAPGPGEEPFEF
jgi:hypothetical protein